MANIKLYRNSRFNGVNKPHSLAIVKSGASLVKSVTNGNISQGEGLSYIDVNITSQDATAVDFIIVEGNDGKEVGYTIQSSHETLSPNCVRFYLKVAALSTILPTADILSGSAERMSIDTTVDDSEYFTNLEPFKPANLQIAVPVALDGRVTPSCYNILEVLALPPQMVKVEEGFVSITDKTDGGANNIKFNNTFGQVIDGILSFTHPTYGIVKNQIAGSTQARQIIDSANSQLYSTSVVSSVGDTNYRKMFPTQLTLPGLNGIAGNTISTGTRWFLESDIPSVIPQWDEKQLCATSSIINDLRGVGADNNITAFWSVPTFYISGLTHTQYNCNADGKTDNVGGISAITASILNHYITATPFAATTYEPKNNKAIYGQGLTLTVFNGASGSRLTKQMWEISNPTNLPSSQQIVADYSISADLRADGCPIFAWKYQRGNQLLGFPETLSGGNWRQIPVSGENKVGSYWEQRNIDNAHRKNQLDTVIGAAGNIATGIGTGAILGNLPGAIVGGITGAVGTVGSFISQDTSIQQQQELLNQQGQVANAELQINSSNYIRDCGYNAFYGYYSVYEEQDIKDFDMFLTKYGYNVGNKEFTKDDLYTREYFNYIKANDVHFSSGQWSDYLINAAIEELKQGVRIWHDIPDEDAYINGNRS